MATALHISNIWLPALLFLVPLIGILITSVLHARRWHRAVRAHVESREAITDGEFLQRGGFSSDDGGFALAVRDAMADLMAAPPETVYPNDTFEYVVSFENDGLNMHHVKYRIEESLQVRCPPGFWTPLLQGKNEYDLTVGEIAAHLIENRAKPIPRKKRRRRDKAVGLPPGRLIRHQAGSEAPQRAGTATVRLLLSPFLSVTFSPLTSSVQSFQAVSSTWALPFSIRPLASTPSRL